MSLVTRHITGSTVVLACCKGDCQSQWKTPIFLAPHSSETPQPISIKFETDDYVGDMTPHAKFGFCTFSGGVSSK